MENRMNITIKNIISSIPEEFRKRQLHMTGDSSIRWFEKLPEILEKVVIDWSLNDLYLVDEMTFNNVLVYANSLKYGDVVVKIGHPEYELFFYEPEALRIYNGQDACQLYELDSKNRVMLLERLSPGEQLTEVCDMRNRIRLACNLLKKINKPLNEEVIFPSYEKMIPDYFQRAKVIVKDNKQLLNLMNDALKFFSEIMSEKHMKVLTHGDYHYRNILKSENRYKVIDPKGIIGFGFMDTVQIINSELKISNNSWDVSILNQILCLVSEYTGYSINLLGRWMFVVSVLKSAGDVIYIKSNKKKMQEKVKRNEFYLKYCKHFME